MNSRKKARTTSTRERRKPIRILFTCAGRRIELIRAFEKAGKALNVKLEIHGADASRLSPALQIVKHAHIVPAIATGRYIEAILRLVRRENIDLLIPLLDSELPDIAQAREQFAKLGCTALISSPQVVQTCRDKMATFRALQAAGIDTPQTWPWIAMVDQKQHSFPYYLKPRHGSAAKGNFIIRDLDELRVLGCRVPDAIVQEFIDGDEYTLDVYTGMDGVTRCVVPRRRLEVRTGEVSKGIVDKNREIMAVGKRVAKILGECRGVITVQLIVTPQRQTRVIEINPRFGGGVPLAIHAGADFPKWILQEFLGRRPRISPTGFRDGIAMLRFDDSVFVSGAKRMIPPAKRPGDRQATHDANSSSSL